MISGELNTMPLADLLQWAETAGISARVTVTHDAHKTVLGVADRCLVGVSDPSSAATSVREYASNGRLVAFPPGAEALERVMDLFLIDGGDFQLEPCPPQELAALGVEVRTTISRVVFEGMRARDEWPRIAELYPDDRATLRFVGSPLAAGESPVARALLGHPKNELTVGEARAALGLSRPALLRHIHALRGQGVLEVAGVKGEVDPFSRLGSQVLKLMEEEQFNEARMVLDSLLAADPTDPALQGLAELLEETHADALEEEFGAGAPPSATGKKSTNLSHTEEAVLELVDGKRTVQRILLDSPLRRHPTLQALEQLRRRKVVEIPIQASSAVGVEP
jgi:DNA-binding transcriptional ArsR family regulator